MAEKGLTIVYYTANRTKPEFSERLRNYLLVAADDIPIISVSQKPMDFGRNICVGDIGQKVYNVYRQLLIGAKKAETEYIATAEDDILYSHDHYHSKVPDKGVFLYDMNRWHIYTWSKPPVFSYKEGRALLHQMICRRDDLIATLEERFRRYTDEDNIPLDRFGEPGRYEVNMGLTPVGLERFMSGTPSVMFSHPESLSYQQRARKKLGTTVVTHLEPWGSAEDVVKIYG